MQHGSSDRVHPTGSLPRVEDVAIMAWEYLRPREGGREGGEKEGERRYSGILPVPVLLLQGHHGVRKVAGPGQACPHVLTVALCQH